jgi:cell division protein ZapA
VRDKQDALAMCALKLGTNAEVVSMNYDKTINSTNERLTQINQLLNETGK